LQNLRLVLWHLVLYPGFIGDRHETLIVFNMTTTAWMGPGDQTLRKFDSIHPDLFIQTYSKLYILKSNTPILFTKLCSQRHVSTRMNHHHAIHRTVPKISQMPVYISGSQNVHSNAHKVIAGFFLSPDPEVT
jgi:hypothetical protein